MTIFKTRLDRWAGRMLRTALAAVSLAIGVTAVAQANPAELRRATVQYGDLNLESVDGNQALYTRIRRAAKQVCQQPDMKPLAARSEVAGCISRAIDAAVRQVPSPKLASLHKQFKLL